MNTWRNRPCLWVGSLKVTEIPSISKRIYTYNKSHIKITARFFFFRYIVFLKCIWKTKEPEYLKQCWKRSIRWVKSIYSISKFTIEGQFNYSQVYVVLRIVRHKDKRNRIEYFKNKPVQVYKWFLTNVQKKLMEKRSSF